jgi:hypothetical protein
MSLLLNGDGHEDAQDPMARPDEYTPLTAFAVHKVVISNGGVWINPDLTFNIDG